MDVGDRPRGLSLDGLVNIVCPKCTQLMAGGHLHEESGVLLSSLSWGQ